MTDEVSRNERIKEASDYLRGTLAEGMRDAITGAIVEDDAQLVKFHGTYLQDDRDLLTTIAACGDVNRNVICNPNPLQSRAYAAAIETARAVSDHLLPRTPA